MIIVSMATIERLKRQLRQKSITAVILRHHDCTEKELFMALIFVVELAGRTTDELEYYCQHGHFPGERRPMKLHSAWRAEAREERLIQRRGLRMVEDVCPGIDPATLDKELKTVEMFRGKSADELLFIALHGRDPESFAELASFVAGPQRGKPAECEICHPPTRGGPE
jgi:hypothetical protein